MVEKVIIKDNTKSPIYYLGDLPVFKNGKEFIFKEGVNIIVGENGSGKSTLLNLIKYYLLVAEQECNSSKIQKLYKRFDIDNGYTDFCNGVEVFADYEKNTFKLCHNDEKSDDFILRNFHNAGSYFNQRYLSTGEGMMENLGSLFNYVFEGKTSTVFNYNQFKDTDYNEYYNYIKNYTIKGNEYTFLLDEPDRNLSLNNISQIKSILSFHKPNTQLIVVIHNPLLIYTLSDNKNINFIEMSDNYINSIKKEIEKLIKK